MSGEFPRAKWRTTGWLVALATAVALVSAACGGGGNSTVTAASTTGSGGTTTTKAGGGSSSGSGEDLEGDLSEGETAYKAQCASCHGQNGEGGVGPAMNTVKTVFPNAQDQIDWVKEKATAASGPYGANNSGNAGKGATVGAMPKFDGTLSEDQIKSVVKYEREKFAK